MKIQRTHCYIVHGIGNPFVISIFLYFWTSFIDDIYLISMKNKLVKFYKHSFPWEKGSNMYEFQYGFLLLYLFYVRTKFVPIINLKPVYLLVGPIFLLIGNFLQLCLNYRRNTYSFFSACWSYFLLFFILACYSTLAQATCLGNKNLH